LVLLVGILMGNHLRTDSLHSVPPTLTVAGEITYIGCDCQNPSWNGCRWDAACFTNLCLKCLFQEEISIDSLTD